MNKPYRIVIVGSGLAGMAAADLLSRYGLHVLVADDNAHTGGQLLRKALYTEKGQGRFKTDWVKRHGFKLAERLKQSSIQILNGTQVLGIYPEHSILLETPDGRTSEHRADAIILATGAREKQIPFKGWSLPGVMATGAAQILMKSSGILPGRKTLIGGNSPLMLVLAAEILANRGHVQAVLDQSTIAGKLKSVAAQPSVIPKIIEAVAFFARLVAARVPYKQGLSIVEARGSNQLEEVVVARLDNTGSIIQGTGQIFPTDTLAVGYGFVPNIELSQQAGCAVSYDVDKGGWYVEVSNTMTTSVNNIYAVGEVNGIAGGGKSLVDGQIAAWDLLCKQGIVDLKTCKKQIQPLIRQRNRQLRYGRFLNRFCQLPPHSFASIPDGVTVCRCEEITMGDIRKQLSNGLATMNSIKRATRCGMGNCQARTCGPILSEIISALAEKPPTAIGCTSARAPVKAVSIDSLARMNSDNSDVGNTGNLV
jgi:NADPH-dependent 2,4-dienoyl-CoA reductase/sulfur reductase-like enzyme